MQRSFLRSSATKPHSSAWGPACMGAVVGTVLALVIYAPASWLAKGITVASQGRVQLLEVQGTIWQGSAALVLAAAAGGNSAMTWPSRWQWRIRPQLTGLQAQLHTDCCTPSPLQFEIGLGGVQAQAASLHMPIALLQGLGTPWNTLQLQGDLQLQWSSLQVNWQTTWQGDVQMRAMHLSTRLSTLPDIGSYQVQIQGGKQPSLHVTTLQGALQLEGRGQLHQGRWRFQGQAYAQPEYAQALANLLNLLGQRAGDKTRIQWS